MYHGIRYFYVNSHSSHIYISRLTNNQIQNDYEKWCRAWNLFVFSDSHLAPKFFKVVANSKKVGHHFQRQKNPFFYAVSTLDGPSKIKLGKRSLTCYNVDTRMEDIQLSSSPTL